ncbi:MAG TPA: hypothetical protein VMH28_04760 [Candidatus Acidoferrales bacterium]|nr:hypothetical protein [Candidatus Acidoferrales bacterium]
MIRLRTVLKTAIAAALLVLLAGVLAPFFTVETYARRLQSSLSRALGRPVELGNVHFSLFKGPGFSVDHVIIYEDPSIGLEPFAYIEEPGSLEVVPSIWSLLGGRFVISSIRLDEASINLTKSGPASEWGRWNFASFVNPEVIHSAPAIHVRNGRIHFKFGDTKNVFYLTETDLDLSPTVTGDWKIECSARPARSDRPAQGLGSFQLKGRWYREVNRFDVNLQVDHTGLGEVTALISGEDAGVHGSLSSRLHFAGPLNNLGIAGRVDISDIHRWDMLPGNSEGGTLYVSGRLDLIGQQLELHSSTPGNAPLPLAVHFRATDYLSQPHWAVALNWNRFPIEPVLEFARHMGAQVAPRLRFAGTMDGAIGYSGRGSLQGGVAFHDAALTIPDSPPVRVEQASLVFGGGHAHFSPALVRSGDKDQARIEADYGFDSETLALGISTDGMNVQSLRAQVSLAAVPGLEQFTSGEWSGDLRYVRDPRTGGWSGHFTLSDARIAVPGLAHPIQIASARAQIDGARLTMDRIAAQAGKLPFAAEYRYEPGTARPHRLRLRAETWDAADLEAELMPTLRRATNLFARALGRVVVTDWLRERNLDGTLQIDDLAVAGAHLENLRARLLWDVARVQVENLQARLEGAALAGKLDVNLRGSRPNYRLAARMKGVAWQNGKLDLDGTLETFGTGVQLVTNLNAEGAFSGTNFDLGGLAPLRTAAGSFNLSWWQSGPRLLLTGLNLRTDEDTYTGRGATQEDGRLMVVLTSGAKEMRMTGTLAKLKIE